MLPEALVLPLLGSALAIAVVVLLVHVRFRKREAARYQSLASRLQEFRRQYNSSLEDSRALLNKLPDVVLIFERHWPKLLFANRQALELFGCSSEQELMDKVFSQPDAWLSAPHSLLDFEELLSRTRELGVERREWRFSAGPDQSLWMDCEVTLSMFAGEPAMIFSGVNIHHRKLQSIADNLRQRALFSVNDGSSLESIIERVSKLLETQIPGTHCVISLYDEQKDSLITQGVGEFAEAFCSDVPSVSARFGATSIGSAAHTRQSVICESLTDDLQWQGYADVLRSLGVVSAWSEPVLGEAGDLKAVITLFSDVPKRPDNEVVGHFSFAVSLIGLAIEREQWRLELEASSENERYVREVSVSIVNVPSEGFSSGLTCVIQGIKSKYDLGSIEVWRVDTERDLIVPVSSTDVDLEEPAEGSERSSIALERFNDLFPNRDSKYVTPQDDLYGLLKTHKKSKPVLVVPLHSDSLKGYLLGILVVEPKFQYVEKSTIEHLSVIGSVMKTSLINQRLVEHLADTADTERRARKKLESELAVAKSIQMSMVPGNGSYFKELRNWRVESWLNPASAVGGDLYEVIPLSRGRFLAAVGDVSDKGVPAALFMAKTISLLNFLAHNKDGDLKSITSALNQELCRGNDACMFVTLVMVLVEKDTGRVEMMNAGHTMPMQGFRDRPPHLWSGETIAPLGLYENIVPATEFLEIPTGGSLVLYSDGVTEAFNAAGEEFGEQRLLSLGGRPRGHDECFLTNIRERLVEYTAGAEQSDDITIMILSRQGS
ncbi:GAF domain-containing SpoIIE family protein phosphatase [Marinobacter sp. MDS2]|uniref:GAF domain-containing SpoIIE family protein phosphatase n=1 Tax=Marinobacter sp. MDS2 TaxID=3065961 RepID=UPI00273AD462|nr:SpoIIE family protein phosphatase [Marinobacter sp. MDS2]MDP4548545.1 SpoIIE family protein phosphatase [Marinobacter sp. MDS2]